MGCQDQLSQIFPSNESQGDVAFPNSYRFDTAGSGKVVYDLVKHIDKAKFEPHIACDHKRGVFFKSVEALNVPIHIQKCSANYRPFISLPLRIRKKSG